MKFNRPYVTIYRKFNTNGNRGNSKAESPGTNFIHEIIDNDLKEKRIDCCGDTFSAGTQTAICTLDMRNQFILIFLQHKNTAGFVICVFDDTNPV